MCRSKETEGKSFKLLQAFTILDVSTCNKHYWAIKHLKVQKLRNHSIACSHACLYCPPGRKQQRGSLKEGWHICAFKGTVCPRKQAAVTAFQVANPARVADYVLPIWKGARRGGYTTQTVRIQTDAARKASQDTWQEPRDKESKKASVLPIFHLGEGTTWSFAQPTRGPEKLCP